MAGGGEGPPGVWGQAREMNALEALMWRAEADPRLRSTICSLEVLDTTPDWDRFLAAVDWATRLVPRFRQRVVEPALGLGHPAWVVDRDFDLHYHVRRVRLPGDGGWEAALRLAEQLAMVPFDRFSTQSIRVLATAELPGSPGRPLSGVESSAETKSAGSTVWPFSPYSEAGMNGKGGS